MDECNYKKVKVRDKQGNEIYALYDKARQLLFFNYITVDCAMNVLGFEIVVDESEDKGNECKTES